MRVGDIFMICLIIFLTAAAMGAFDSTSTELKDCQERLTSAEITIHQRQDLLIRCDRKYRNMYDLYWECRETLSACVEDCATMVEVTR